MVYPSVCAPAKDSFAISKAFVVWISPQSNPSGASVARSLSSMSTYSPIPAMPLLL